MIFIPPPRMRGATTGWVIRTARCVKRGGVCPTTWTSSRRRPGSPTLRTRTLPTTHTRSLWVPSLPCVSLLGYHVTRGEAELTERYVLRAQEDGARPPADAPPRQQLKARAMPADDSARASYIASVLASR